MVGMIRKIFKPPQSLHSALGLETTSVHGSLDRIMPFVWQRRFQKWGANVTAVHQVGATTVCKTEPLNHWTPRAG